MGITPFGGLFENMELTMQHLVFAIDGGDTAWLSAHDTREEAIEAANEAGKIEGRWEFVFVVESSHFVSNI